MRSADEKTGAKRQHIGRKDSIFGRVVEGMGVVDAIKGVRTTTRGGLSDVPVDPVIIEQVRVLSADEAAPYAGGSN